VILISCTASVEFTIMSFVLVVCFFVLEAHCMSWYQEFIVYVLSWDTRFMYIMIVVNNLCAYLAI
jgi:hypothetical protein